MSKTKPTSTGEVKPRTQKKTAEQLLAEERVKDPKGMKKLDKVVEKAEKVVAKQQIKATAPPVTTKEDSPKNLLNSFIEVAKEAGLFVSTHKSGATAIRTKEKVLCHLQPTRKGITHYHYQKGKGFVAGKDKISDEDKLIDFINSLKE